MRQIGNQISFDPLDYDENAAQAKKDRDAKYFELRKQGVKTVHFVAPSFWAWRANRLEKIRASVDHVLCIFPFEPALLAQHGIAATYVGHPLANVIPMAPDRLAARLQLGLLPNDQVVALLPGSRGSEVRNLATRFFQAAQLLQRERPAVKFIVPAIPALKAEIERAAASCSELRHLQIVEGQSHTLLAACDVCLVASGTATLEAALFKSPMVIAYHMSWLSWQLVRHRMLQPWVGLPNILCRDFVVPELLQDAATPQALCRSVLNWLDAQQQAPEKIAALQAKFSALHAELQRDTPRLAAHAIAQVLQA